jgi:hypothetical protein
MAVVNPTQFTITDASITAQGVTGFQIKFGQVSGGPYTLTAQVPASDINASAGTVTGTIASLNTTLAAGNWFAVSEAINAAGVSTNSPEAAFTIEAVPGAPTGFSVA